MWGGGQKARKKPERGPGAGPASIPQWASLLRLNLKVNIIGHPPLTIRYISGIDETPTITNVHREKVQDRSGSIIRYIFLMVVCGIYI